MKINQYSQTPLKAYSDNRVNNAADKTQAQQQSSAPSRDVVNVSSQARLLGAARQTATESPDTREHKVRELREQVRSGTYKPDIRKTAMNLVRDEVDFLK
ncbi:flagellar biosynthesis anti-sigma factor FlgM [Maridesulfovibrio salexigens]|uniref:Negative regulator of flagellin synthesis n=1 Tax=Maridesulfovibrio salexigens (strain ATCC 14822 / DSM 2638 / NCIMB 8403 / VKM B-1763) TaxID=526222 RepID=C6C0F1_MARSD|nr:flagellar biosynthesis anti-sigma factor FlgM [Maridesulfovibrio salexigens]ACS79085.1 Anti-sigma-28 factor FlgM family protein [Maridesulfovibrio salexigens DSM 2638]